LVVVASLFNPEDLQDKNTFQVKIIFKPFDPNKREFLQVFENDEELNDFFSNLGEVEKPIQSISKNCIKSESLFSQGDSTKKLKEEESA